MKCLSGVLVYMHTQAFFRVPAAAGRLHELAPTFVLERAPVLVGATHQRDVARILEVRLADDPALAVMGTVCVRGCEAIETEHAAPTARQMEGGRAPQRAQAGDDDVVVFAHSPVRAAQGMTRTCDYPVRVSGTRPKRRWRWWKSATAAFSSAAPNSGHITGVKCSSA